MLHITIHDRAVWSIPILNKRNILALYKSHVFSSWAYCSQVSFSAPRCFFHEKIAPESCTNKHKLLSKSEQDPITEREVRSNLLVTFFNDLHGSIHSTNYTLQNWFVMPATRDDKVEMISEDGMDNLLCLSWFVNGFLHTIVISKEKPCILVPKCMDEHHQALS